MNNTIKTGSLYVSLDMDKIKDLTGNVYGRLTVISHYVVGRRSYCKCICTCGNERTIASSNLKNSHTQSCGCLKLERLNARSTTHGDCGSREYKIWCNIKDRCHNPKNHAYSRYGGRNILVCDRWLNSYENFLADMGRVPTAKHSIERKENNKGYSPDNCKWATVTEQANNKRNNILIEYNDTIKTLSTWCRELGLGYKITHQRIYKLGWEIPRAFLFG